MSREEPKLSYTYPRSARRRRGVELTLSDEARVELDRLADEAGTCRSRLVEGWIMERTTSSRSTKKGRR